MGCCCGKKDDEELPVVVERGGVPAATVAVDAAPREPLPEVNERADGRGDDQGVAEPVVEPSPTPPSPPPSPPSIQEMDTVTDHLEPLCTEEETLRAVSVADEQACRDMLLVVHGEGVTRMLISSDETVVFHRMLSEFVARRCEQLEADFANGRKPLEIDELDAKCEVFRGMILLDEELTFQNGILRQYHTEAAVLLDAAEVCGRCELENEAGGQFTAATRRFIEGKSLIEMMVEATTGGWRHMVVREEHHERAGITRRLVAFCVTNEIVKSVLLTVRHSKHHAQLLTDLSTAFAAKTLLFVESSHTMLASAISDIHHYVAHITSTIASYKTAAAISVFTGTALPAYPPGAPERLLKPSIYKLLLMKYKILVKARRIKARHAAIRVQMWCRTAVSQWVLEGRRRRTALMRVYERKAMEHIVELSRQHAGSPLTNEKMLETVRKLTERDADYKAALRTLVNTPFTGFGVESNKGVASRRTAAATYKQHSSPSGETHSERAALRIQTTWRRVTATNELQIRREARSEALLPSTAITEMYSKVLMVQFKGMLRVKRYAKRWSRLRREREQQRRAVEESLREASAGVIQRTYRCWAAREIAQRLRIEAAEAKVEEEKNRTAEIEVKFEEILVDLLRTAQKQGSETRDEERSAWKDLTDAFHVGRQRVAAEVRKVKRGPSVVEEDASEARRGVIEAKVAEKKHSFEEKKGEIEAEKDRIYKEASRISLAAEEDLMKEAEKYEKMLEAIHENVNFVGEAVDRAGKCADDSEVRRKSASVVDLEGYRSTSIARPRGSRVSCASLPPGTVRKHSVKTAIQLASEPVSAKTPYSTPTCFILTPGLVQAVPTSRGDVYPTRVPPTVLQMVRKGTKATAFQSGGGVTQLLLARKGFIILLDLTEKTWSTVYTAQWDPRWSEVAGYSNGWVVYYSPETGDLGVGRWSGDYTKLVEVDRTVVGEGLGDLSVGGGCAVVCNLLKSEITVVEVGSSGALGDPYKVKFTFPGIPLSAHAVTLPDPPHKPTVCVLLIDGTVVTASLTDPPVLTHLTLPVPATHVTFSGGAWVVANSSIGQTLLSSYEVPSVPTTEPVQGSRVFAVIPVSMGDGEGVRRATTVSENEIFNVGKLEADSGPCITEGVREDGGNEPVAMPVGDGGDAPVEEKANAVRSSVVIRKESVGSKKKFSEAKRMSLHRLSRSSIASSCLGTTPEMPVVTDGCLDCSHRGFTDTNSLSLIVALSSNNGRFSSLNLSHNSLGDDFAAAMTPALKYAFSLTSLDLSFNDLTTAGARHLVTAIVTNTSLKSVNLQNNAKVSPAALNSVAQALLRL